MTYDPSWDLMIVLRAQEGARELCVMVLCYRARGQPDCLLVICIVLRYSTVTMLPSLPPPPYGKKSNTYAPADLFGRRRMFRERVGIGR